MKYSIFIFLSILLSGICVSCDLEKKSLEGTEEIQIQTERLRVSHTNPHLLETESGKPVFLNNFTAWSLIKKGTREDIAELIALCKSHKFNMVSCVIGSISSHYQDTLKTHLPFECDYYGNPDPLRPITTTGNNPDTPGEYDYWDHVDYLIDYTSDNGMYLSLHPIWGGWVVGGFNGERTGEKSYPVIFNEDNAYQYGRWLGQRYGNKGNIIWMLGGDRSAVYDSQTFSFSGRLQEIIDHRKIFRAMAEGLADGTNHINKQDGKADYSKTLLSYHPRKWAPNSSEWFQNDQWLSFNSTQDAPYDQIIAIPHDYEQMPVKPTWLFEGRYEGRINAWGIRLQAYQTVLSGAFGHTYGSPIWDLPSNWREFKKLPGVIQMRHLYKVAREIWTDAQFLNRMPDPDLIIGDQGSTFGDGRLPAVEMEEDKISYKKYFGSDRITAMRGNDGSWAMVYSANGRDIALNLSHLKHGKMDGYWFNPRNGEWWANDAEHDSQTPFVSGLNTGEGVFSFDPPGDSGPDCDWVLVLK